MANNITLPLQITLENWTAELNTDLPQYQIPILSYFPDWQEWAAQLINANNLSTTLLPVREVYKTEDSWVIWATFFVDQLTTGP